MGAGRAQRVLEELLTHPNGGDFPRVFAEYQAPWICSGSEWFNKAQLPQKYHERFLLASPTNTTTLPPTLRALLSGTACQQRPFFDGFGGRSTK